MPVYLRGPDDSLVRLIEQPYASEGLLQELVAKHPELLAGDDDSADRWLLISREMATPGDESLAWRWSLDHLFVDNTGVPTLVEVKRSSDTRIRREVVGQLLDYAANAVVYWPQGALPERFAQTCKDLFERDPDEELSAFLDEGEDPDEFWDAVEANLRAGRLRLVFVADVIPRELQRVVEFLNEQMHRTEVLAVEIRQYVGEGDHQTLVPRTIGQTAAADAAKQRRATKRWTQQEYLEAIEATGGPGLRTTAEEYLAWGNANGGHPEWGSGTTRGSLQFRWEVDGQRVRPGALLTNGWLYVAFAQLANVPPFTDRQVREAYATKLNGIDDITVPEGAVDRWPEFPALSLGTPTARTQFLDAVDWFLETLGRTPAPRAAQEAP